jgi:hypothetical protein
MAHDLLFIVVVRSTFQQSFKNAEGFQMARRILILIYILSVLAVSGFSRADSRISAIVANAEFNLETSIITVHGVGSITCVEQPQLEVSRVDLNTNTVQLTLTTLGSYGRCAGVYAKPFELAYNLRNLNLPIGRTYNIVFENVSTNIPTIVYTPTARNFAGSQGFSQEEIDNAIKYFNDKASR